MAGQPVQGELQHNFGGARRQGAIARDVLQSPKKTANIDQQPGELGAYCVQCLTYVLPNRDDRFGQRISPITSAAATNQLDVVRGINCARVKSGRSRSPTAVDELRSMSSVAPTPGRKATERALDLIDDDTDATEIRFDLLLRQDRVLRRAGRFSTLVAAASAAARMEWGLFDNGHWTCLPDVFT